MIVQRTISHLQVPVEHTMRRQKTPKNILGRFDMIRNMRDNFLYYLLMISTSQRACFIYHGILYVW